MTVRFVLRKLFASLGWQRCAKMVDSAKVQNTNRSVDDWIGKWEKGGKPMWHQDDVNKNLQEHFELLVGKEGKKTILFPLCGKTVDMRWVAEKGHNAVGVEGSDIAAESFFEENNIEYKRAAINLAPNGVQILSSLDDRIRIFVCNFFDFQSSVAGGKLDAAFDRGSLVAVNPKDRSRYANKMADLLKPGGKILAECFEYDPTVFGGPPHHVPEAHLREIYEENFVVDKLSKEVDENPRFKNNFHIDEMTMCVYLKTRK